MLTVSVRGTQISFTVRETGGMTGLVMTAVTALSVTIM